MGEPHHYAPPFNTNEVDIVFAKCSTYSTSIHPINGIYLQTQLRCMIYIRETRLIMLLHVAMFVTWAVLRIVGFITMGFPQVLDIPFGTKQ